MITDITEVSRLREQVALKRNLESLGEMSAAGSRVQECDGRPARVCPIFAER